MQHEQYSEISYASKHTSPIITDFTESSVGISTGSLSAADWSFDKKVSGYIEQLIQSNSVNMVPKLNYRPPGSVSQADQHAFQADSRLRDEHLRSLKPLLKDNVFLAYDENFHTEAIFHGAMFLRNIQEVLKMGDKIHQSLFVREHDLDERHTHAVDTFYIFFDSFLLRYYAATSSKIAECREHFLKSPAPVVYEWSGQLPCRGVTNSDAKSPKHLHANRAL